MEIHSGIRTARNTPSRTQRKGASFDGGFRGGGSSMAGFSFEVSSISVVPEGGSFAHSVPHSVYECT